MNSDPQSTNWNQSTNGESKRKKRKDFGRRGAEARTRAVELDVDPFGEGEAEAAAPRRTQEGAATDGAGGGDRSPDRNGGGRPSHRRRHLALALGLFPVR